MASRSLLRVNADMPLGRRESFRRGSPLAEPIPPASELLSDPRLRSCGWITDCETENDCDIASGSVVTQPCEWRRSYISSEDLDCRGGVRARPLNKT